MTRRGLVGPLVLVLLALSARGQAPPEVLRATIDIEGRTLVVAVDVESGWHVNAHRPRQAYLIPTALDVEPPTGVRVGAVAYPEPVDRTLPFSDEPLLLYEGRFTLRVPIESAETAGVFRAVLHYQACDDTRCLAPRTLELEAGGGRAAVGAAATSEAAADRNQIASLVEQFGLGVTFLLVALAGLALNLTPCVYPMMSVTVAYFGGRSGDSRTRTIEHALLYVLGICITFSLLGVAAAVTGSLFGAALQQPMVLGGISVLMVALALSNFGLYQIRMPEVLMRAAGRGGEGALGALFMGLTMGIVGAPCIGPIVAALLLYVGAEQSPLLGFGLFFVLGLGMGLPYVALAVAAGKLRRLPRAGAWLGWVEWLFGFLLLGLALYFATPLLPPVVVRAGWALLVGVAGIVLGIVHPVGPPAVQWALRLGGLVIAAYGVSTLTIAEPAHRIAWASYSDARFAAARDDGRPVLIDFEADWCLPCRKMDRTTFRDDVVVEVAESFVMLKADVTEQDADADALMRQFEVPGVPTYVLIDGTGREHRRFTGFVDSDAMAAAMRETAESAQRG